MGGVAVFYKMIRSCFTRADGSEGQATQISDGRAFRRAISAKALKEGLWNQQGVSVVWWKQFERGTEF